MSLKEILLLLAVGVSIFLYVKALFTIEKLPLDKEQKQFYRFVSFIIPIVGYFLVYRKAKSYKRYTQKIIN